MKNNGPNYKQIKTDRYLKKMTKDIAIGFDL